MTFLCSPPICKTFTLNQSSPNLELTLLSFCIHLDGSATIKFEKLRTMEYLNGFQI